MDAKVLELPKFRNRENCKDSFQLAVTKLTTAGFKKQNRTNAILYFLIVALAVVSMAQTYAIYKIAHKPNTIILDSQTDYTGLENVAVVPLEELK